MPENEKCQTLPPWLWIWFALYVYMLPTQIELLKENLESFFFSTDPAYTSITLVNRFKMINAPYWIPSIFLFLGILSVFFPWTREQYITKKYNLTENYQLVPAMKEIENFLKVHAPDLKITANILSQQEEVFIYPKGYRKTGIAIFGKFIKAWRSDRENAQIVLLHEIGHYRNGDALILGAGSFFEFVVKHSIGIIAFFFIIQIPLVFMDLTDSTSNSILVAFFFFINAITDPVIILFQTLAFFTLPIAGIWSAELNADRFMLTSKLNSTYNSLEVVGKLKKESSLKKWILSQVTHPPNSLRQWMAVHSDNKKSVLLFLFLFPIAHLFQLLMLILYALASYFIAFLFGVSNIQEIIDSLLKNIMLYLDTRSFTWLFFSMAIISWPFIAIYWVRFFSGIRETYNLDNYKSYFLSAFVLLCVFILSYSI
jgi:Zn-dependent protease with chaperone function